MVLIHDCAPLARVGRWGATASLTLSLLLTTICTTSCVPAPADAADKTASVGVYQVIQEPEEGYAPLVSLIEHARNTIRVTLYQLADPAASRALIDASRRGVQTKVILDKAFHGERVNKVAFAELESAGVQVRWAPAGVIYHQKTISVDGEVSAIGTGNLVSRYYTTGRDAWVLSRNPADVAAVDSTFDADFGVGKTGRPPQATDSPNLIWSPAARASFLQLISQAQQSIDLTTEVLKDRPIVLALSRAASRGVQCRIVLNKDPAWEKAIQEVSAGGCSVHQLPKGTHKLYMHEKMILIDGQTLVIGSHNLSTASLLQNRELSLKLTRADAGQVIDSVAGTFEADYARAQ